MNEPELQDLDNINKYDLQPDDEIIVKDKFRMRVKSLTDGGVKISYRTGTFWIPFALVDYLKERSE